MHIDRVLAAKPKKDGHALSLATMGLTALRDSLIAHRRQGELGPAQRLQLEHVNAIITVVLGVHFPLGDVPWHELETARGWLTEAIAMSEPA